MEIRYLTRIEFVAGSHALHLDVRTSDWVARLVAALGAIVPRRWRGSPQQRARREAVRSIVQRSTTEASEGHDHWLAVLEQLRGQFESGRLGAMSPDEIRLLPDSVSAPAAPF